MASPLSYLRKNQYLMLVGFGILLMFAFVVAPPLQDYLQSRAMSAQDPVLIKWKYGQVRRSDLDRMALNHNVLHNFMDAVQRRTTEKKGVPKVRPLPRAQSEGDLIDTMLLAKEAEKRGMRVSDEAVNHYLEQLSDSVLTQEDFADLFEANDRITRSELYNRLRTELLAQNMQRLYASALPVPTPADLWKAHDRLAREVKLEVLPLPVENYVSAVKEEPSKKELEELFESGKTLPPSDEAPEPGFYILPKASFDYVKADFSKFLEEAKKTVTEEEIKARYESGIKLNEFRKEKPADTTPKDPPPPPPVLNPPDAPKDKPEDEPKDKPADSPKDEPKDKPADAPKDEPKDKPADAPKDEPKDKPADAPQDEPKDKPAKNLPPLEVPDNSSFLQPSTQFVSLQEPQDEPKADEPKADEPKADEPKDAKAKDAPKADEPKDKPADEPKDKPADEPKDKPADEPKADPEAGGESKDGDDTPFQEDEVEFKPLEEVRDEIVLELARGRAQTKMDEALDAAEREVQAHFRKRIQWEAMKVQAKEGEEPEPAPALDVNGIAKRHGLEAGSTGLHDANSIDETDLGQCSREMPSMFGGPGDTITFADEAFRGDQKLYDPARASQGDDLTFLYWRTEMTEGRVPEFSDVEKQVREAWTRNKARELATQEAEKLVDQAASKSLKEAAAERADKVFETDRFTWLTSNLPPQMAAFGAQPRLSKVPGIDGAGNEFMSGVFSLDKGEAGVVTNTSKSEVYVVKVIDESSETDLRTDFIADVPTTEIQLAYSATNQVFRQRLDELQQEMELVFVGVQ